MTLKSLTVKQFIQAMGIASKGLRDRDEVMANKSVTVIFIAIMILSTGGFGKSPDSDQAKPVNQLAKATSDLVSATSQYKASIEALIPPSGPRPIRLRSEKGFMRKASSRKATLKRASRPFERRKSS
jgi:hypothetical protein